MVIYLLMILLSLAVGSILMKLVGDLDEALYKDYKNDVILAYQWSIKMYTDLLMVI